MTTREQIIAAASDAGLQLIWDGKLGREDYHSIMGSFPSLERFYAIAFAAGQESLRQQLAERDAEIAELKRSIKFQASGNYDYQEELKEERDDHIRRKMILRSAIGAWDRAEPDELQAAECGLLKALAATDDLKENGNAEL